MAVTNADIQAWVNQNKGASEQTIASAMQQYGVTPQQMSQATGWNQSDVTSRYNALTQPTQTAAPTTSGGVASPKVSAADIQAYHNNALSNGYSIQQINADMKKYGVSIDDYLNATYTNPNESKQALYNYLDVVNPSQAEALRYWEGGANEWLTKRYITPMAGSTPSNAMFNHADPFMNAKLNLANGAPQMANPALQQLPQQQQQQPDWANQMQNWWNQQQQQQQAPASYTPNAQSSSPQYTPNYANNALMRPITENSNITGQNQYGNMGFNNKRSSLWGDW
jgi:hypothetical protein